MAVDNACCVCVEKFSIFCIFMLLFPTCPPLISLPFNELAAGCNSPVQCGIILSKLSRFLGNEKRKICECAAQSESTLVKETTNAMILIEAACIT